MRKTKTTIGMPEVQVDHVGGALEHTCVTFLYIGVTWCKAVTRHAAARRAAALRRSDTGRTLRCFRWDSSKTLS